MVTVRKSPAAAVRLGNRRGARGSHGSSSLQNALVVLVGSVAVMSLGLAWYILRNGMAESAGGPGLLRTSTRQTKKLPIPSEDNAYNAIAFDIIRTLSCDSMESVLEKESPKVFDAASTTKRKLAEEAEEFGDKEEEKEKWLQGDDIMLNNEDPLYTSKRQDVNAKHLMCLVAGAEKLPSHVNKDSFRCDAVGTRREALLDVWSSARSQMTADVINTVLGLAVETEKVLVDKTMQIWAPYNDDSLDYYLGVLNEEKSGIRTLESVLGHNRLFVDIGSGLGLSSIAASLLYPGTTVLPVEPAAPSWLLSRLNMVCNLPLDTNTPNPLLAGVGPRHDGMGKMMWRPSSTGTTRAWTPKSEMLDEDIEIIVRLRTLRSILAEAAAEEELEADPPTSVVLNVDCEGCEYNLIPSLSEGEIDALDTIIGTTGVHFGYIPADKKPSSKRAKKTHERLCSHYDFARQSIECCGFKDMKVKRAGSKEKLTVGEIAGELCSGFDSWAAEKGLYDSTDDFGWSEISSMSGIST